MQGLVFDRGVELRPSNCITFFDKDLQPLVNFLSFLETLFSVLLTDVELAFDFRVLFPVDPELPVLFCFRFEPYLLQPVDFPAFLNGFFVDFCFLLPAELDCCFLFATDFGLPPIFRFFFNGVLQPRFAEFSFPFTDLVPLVVFFLFLNIDLQPRVTLGTFFV